MITADNLPHNHTCQFCGLLQHILKEQQLIRNTIQSIDLDIMSGKMSTEDVRLHEDLRGRKVEQSNILFNIVREAEWRLTAHRRETRS